MARGWESKDVESQMEEARDQRQREPSRELSAGQQQSLRELELLKMSRARVLADLEAARNPGYREMLERSLRFLDEKIAAAAIS